ncbi:MAG: hypothetical protein R3A80_03895 [Bdellovibrionota bacterium]
MLRSLGVLFFFAVLWNGYAGRLSQSTAPGCLTHLKDDLTQRTYVHPPVDEPKFEILLDQVWAEKVKNFYRSRDTNEIVSLSKDILTSLLSDFEFLITPELRSDFLFAVEHFIERGGAFVIDMNLLDFEAEAVIVSVRNPAYEYIRVPLYKLLSIELGREGAKENLLWDLVHELRHSITDARTRRKLQRSGVANPDYIYAHVGQSDVNQAIAYAFQLENEAVAAQNRFVPQALNNTGDPSFYPEFQSLQRLLKTFVYKDLEELQRDVDSNSLFQTLTQSYMDRYLSFVDSATELGRLSPKLLELSRKLKSENFDESAFLELAMSEYDYQVNVIRGRLDKERAQFLRDSIFKMFQLNERRLTRVYRQLRELP